MGLTHAEFFHNLPRAIEQRSYTVSGNTVTVDLGDRQVHISLGEQQVRRIAMLSLPYALIGFRFEGFSDVQQEAFMSRFNLYFQRGGG